VTILTTAKTIVLPTQFLRVFNFVILCYLRNSQKLDAHEKLAFYIEFLPAFKIYLFVG